MADTRRWIPDPARGETERTDNWAKNYARNGDQHVMEKRTREGGKMNYELPEYLASKVTLPCLQGYFTSS
jgi:hypothetical protein